MNKSARILVDRLAPSAQSGESVEIYRMLGDLTLDVVGGCAFGGPWCPTCYVLQKGVDTAAAAANVA